MTLFVRLDPVPGRSISAAPGDHWPMDKFRTSCALLLPDRDDLASSAEKYARTLFDVVCSCRSPRSARRLPAEIEDRLLRGDVDYLFNFLSPVILSDRVLKSIRKTSVNFHPAPPAWPGVGSASFALYRGDESFGATAHEMTSDVDAGPIFRTVEFPVNPGDTCETLFDRALDYALLLFYEVVGEMADAGIPQPSGQEWERAAITRREFEDWMTLDPDAPAAEIERKVRAVRHSRFPGPRVRMGGYLFELPPAGDDPLSHS